ncbi:MAG: hypothetical protein KAS16_07675, partial [Thermoplasmata archaeon]|nr:hypothetical protein [Thermoplasmata archaeon]
IYGDEKMSQTSIQNNYTHEIINLISGGTIEPRIGVIGCGGAGCAIVDRLNGSLRNVCTIAINTDQDALNNINVDKKIHIGRSVTFGEDSRGFTEVAEYAAQLSVDEIKTAMKNIDIAFIIAGLGGGTGSGIAHFIGGVAQRNGIVDFGIVIMPFSIEAGRREIAEESLFKLQQVTENTVILDNDSLLRLNPDIHISQAFSIMDRTVGGLIDDIRDRMNRSFIATIADDVMSLNHEFQQASYDDHATLADETSASDMEQPMFA